MNTLKTLKSMSSQELEDLMIERRTQIEELCEWGSESLDDTDKSLRWKARDLADNYVAGWYLDTDKQLIDYIRKAEKVLAIKYLEEALLKPMF